MRVTMNFEEMSKGELIGYINSMNDTETGKYGLIWYNEREPETIVEECDKYIPILKEEKGKNLIGGLVINDFDHFRVFMKDGYIPFDNNPEEWEYFDTLFK